MDGNERIVYALTFIVFYALVHLGMTAFSLPTSHWINIAVAVACGLAAYGVVRLRRARRA